MATLSERLAVLREEKLGGLSFEKFADAVRRQGYEVSQPTVINYLSGETTKIPSEFTAAVSRAFDVDASWLLLGPEGRVGDHKGWSPTTNTKTVIDAVASDLDRRLRTLAVTWRDKPLSGFYDQILGELYLATTSSRELGPWGESLVAHVEVILRLIAPQTVHTSGLCGSLYETAIGHKFPPEEMRILDAYRGEVQERYKDDVEMPSNEGIFPQWIPGSTPVLNFIHPADVLAWLRGLGLETTLDEVTAMQNRGVHVLFMDPEWKVLVKNPNEPAEETTLPGGDPATDSTRAEMAGDETVVQDAREAQ